MKKNEIIKLKNADLAYGKQIVLKNLNLTIQRGDFVGIIGPNGSGKTTILRTFLGLLNPVAGDIKRDTILKFSYVKQRQFLDPIYPLTVEEIVMMGRFPQMGFFLKVRLEDKQKVKEALSMVGIEHLNNKLFSELSEGQKQRVLIARALVCEPDVLLLDEPTNDLDIKGEEQIMRLLKDIHSRLDVTIIMVSHLLHVVLNYVKNVIFLNQEATCLHSVESICEKDLLPKIYDIPVEVKRINNKYVIITGEANECI